MNITKNTLQRALQLTEQIERLTAQRDALLSGKQLAIKRGHKLPPSTIAKMRAAQRARRQREKLQQNNQSTGEAS